MKSFLKAQKIKKLAFSVTILLLISFATTICAVASNSGKNIKNGSLYLSDYNIKLQKGNTVLLHAFVSSNEGVQNAVDFTSADASVATVDSLGNITAVKSGKTVITAKLLGSGSQQSCNVEVSGAGEITTVPTTVPPTVPITSEPTTVNQQYPITLNNNSATVYAGNHYKINATCAAELTWSSSNENVARVSKGIVTAVSAGTASITIASPTHTAKFTLNVTEQKADINISAATASFTRTKTYYLNSKTSNVKWKSSDTSIATVDNGFVYGVKAGTCVISAYTSNGEATCLVTVNPSAPLRYAYTTPNSAPLNSDVNFVAITDKARTAVKFEVTINGNTTTVNASNKTANGDTYIWTGTKKLTTSGQYTVKAYSQYNNTETWSTCSDAATTAFVTKVTDNSITVCEKRRCSDELIDLISQFEGFVSKVEEDVLVPGTQNIGYGHVLYPGDTFYNNLTKKEAYAMLIKTINDNDYSTAINNFYINNSIKFNQYQYDSMVCFVYNLGYAMFSNNTYYKDEELQDVFLNAYEPGSSASNKPGAGIEGYVNGDGVNFRTGPSLSSTVIKTMPINTKFTFLSGNLYNNDWYNVKLSDGTVGYIYSEYASVKQSSSTVRNLDYINKDKLVKAVLQYHHAGGSCVWGLLYRRIDEMELFFNKDYLRDGRSNKYNLTFSCSKDPTFTAP